jgi:hypothetical protein
MSSIDREIEFFTLIFKVIPHDLSALYQKRKYKGLTRITAKVRGLQVGNLDLAPDIRSCSGHQRVSHYFGL